MTVQGHALESTIAQPAALDIPQSKILDQLTPQDYRAVATSGAANTTDSADKHLGQINLVDDKSCEKPQGFWERLGESMGKAMLWEAYANGGPVPPPEADPKACSGSGNAEMTDVQPGTPKAGADTQPATPKNGGEAVEPTQPATPKNGGEAVEPTQPATPKAGADAQPTLPATPGDNTPSSPKGGAEAVEPTHPATPKAGADVQPTQPATPSDITPPTADQKPQTPEVLSPLMKGIQDNVGKPVQELDPKINPRLGCVRMVSHALHEADPSFPETSNTQEFRKALKEHGYEEVNVRPGDPAIGKGQAGDIIVGHRPDGMPSHSAINMGDGKVFNNNSDTGKGQLDNVDQFNQGMHDKNGHWMKNGFDSVTIYRKKEATANGAMGV